MKKQYSKVLLFLILKSTVICCVLIRYGGPIVLGLLFYFF